MNEGQLEKKILSAVVAFGLELSTVIISYPVAATLRNENNTVASTTPTSTVGVNNLKGYGLERPYENIDSCGAI
jgi:hypothetical protein